MATITAAAVTDPHSVGLYSWAVLALTFYQSVSDLPIRQIAVGLIGVDGGERFLRRYAIYSGGLGLCFMSFAVTSVSILSSRGLAINQLLELLPLTLVPVAQAIATRPTAVLQHDGSWGRVSFCRTSAALAAVAIGVPTVLAFHSIIGACVAVMVAELLNSILIRRASRALRYSDYSHHRSSTSSSNIANSSNIADYWHMAVYSVLGWLQAQSGRVLLGAWAGTSTLGSYSLGYSVGRSAGDAIAASQANILRVDLTRQRAKVDLEIRAIVAANLRAGLALSVISASGAVIFSYFVLHPILGAEWDSALSMVPILALTAVPMAIASSSAPVHVHRGNARIAFIAPAVCLLFAPAIAVAAISSLVLAAWTVLLRECVLASLQAIFMGKATPWREVAYAAAVIVTGALAIATLR
ncbi:oligosaccharide flippase family protein [Mycolicibacterium sp. OfavD-34-C]|uniref:oligosaccharide flippase family protein n=1 Tax=Mycolicibacterium sp. OfavD-34-C TaxID=2917746 RepID=UPI001EF63367|nr:oligosaccharide flippase family protein [Mycolicibacterium sp. OfavD-34-C]MCG7580089.1 oligosaccharide flippase family protein [Mycolicibacterium sp. OfavD-34-C]